MRSLIINLLALFLHPRRLLSEKTVVAASRFSIQRGNKLKTSRSRIKKSKVSISGNGNSILVDGSDIFNSSFTIEGRDNQLIIKSGTRIFNLDLIIKANKGLIFIDENTSFGGGTVVCAGDSNTIKIGKRCMIAEDVDIWNSDTHTILLHGEETVNCKPIQIHNHVWLGKGVTVLKGVTIGENAIVGMKSVVTHAIQPGTINVGVPATEVRKDANWRT